MSIPMPHAPYFLVKVSKQEQAVNKEKIGNIYIAPSQTFMIYNKQCGEIVAIGERAATYFPEAKVGHTLIMHHFVESNNSNEAKANHLVHEDENYNYYVVTAYEYNGKGAETYGVWDGEKIIPNKNYVFLSSEEPKNADLPADDVINQALKETPSGLLLFDKWEDTRENKEDRMAKIRAEIQALSKSGTQKHHIQKGILEKEKELESLSGDINKKKYIFHNIAFANNELSEWFDTPIKEGDTIGILNIAALTKVKFQEKEYIVAKTSFISCLLPTLVAA